MNGFFLTFVLFSLSSTYVRSKKVLFMSKIGIQSLKTADHWLIETVLYWPLFSWTDVQNYFVFQTLAKKRGFKEKSVTVWEVHEFHDDFPRHYILLALRCAVLRCVDFQKYTWPCTLRPCCNFKLLVHIHRWISDFQNLQGFPVNTKWDPRKLYRYSL